MSDVKVKPCETVIVDGKVYGAGQVVKSEQPKQVEPIKEVADEL